MGRSPLLSSSRKYKGSLDVEKELWLEAQSSRHSVACSPSMGEELPLLGTLPTPRQVGLLPLPREGHLCQTHMAEHFLSAITYLLVRNLWWGGLDFISVSGRKALQQGDCPISPKSLLFFFFFF